jgi:hypothetical protein
LSLFTPAAALANDTAWGGTPGNLFPIQTAEVAMVEEHVELRQNTPKNSWDVKVVFSFKNVSDKPVKLNMGFPFHVIDNIEDTPTSTPLGTKDLKNNDPMVWDFTTTVAGKKVKFKKEKVTLNKEHPELYYEWAYVWPMEFKPGETIEVVNTYRQGITADSSGHIMPYYVLRTGGMWHGGKIGRSRIDIVGDHGSLPCEEGTMPIKPDGHKLERNPAGPILRWDLKDFAPNSDVEGCFRSRQHIRNLEFYTLTDLPLDKMSAAELRIVRNHVFALHGYTFKDKDLQAHFEKMWWYYPNKAFKNSDLSAEERAFVNEVKALETKKK